MTFSAFCSRSLSVAVAVLASDAASAAGQGVERAATRCPPCDVSVWKIDQLTGGSDGLEDRYGFAAVGADGRLYFATMNAGRPLFVGDLTTDRVTTLAPVGSGPGEMRYAARIRRGIGDSILVHDRSLNRMNVFSPVGRFVRSTPFLPGADDFVPLANGSFVVAARVGSEGDPLHLVSAAGLRVRSFGARASDADLPRTQDRYHLFRWLAPASDGSVLAVRPGGYVLERWSADGRLLMERDVAPDWFTPKYERWRERPLEQAPPPFVMSIQEGADGRIWVMVSRADEQWRSAVRPPRRPPALYEVIDRAKFVDTQIEVFDAATFTRVASYRMDQPLGDFVAPGVAASAVATPNEEPIIELFRMRVLGR